MNIIETKTNATVEAIHALDEKSGQIGQIIEVIAGITGQTNLLALNAAIESARVPKGAMWLCGSSGKSANLPNSHKQPLNKSPP